MSIFPLLELFHKVFREKIYKVKFKNSSVETYLLTQATTWSLHELISFQDKLTEDCTVYLESLKLLVAKQDLNRLSFLNHLINAHKRLKRIIPTHQDVFDSAYTDIICTSSSNLQKLSELDNIKIAINYMNDQSIATSNVLEALFGPYTSLVFQEIVEIQLQKIFNNELIQKFINLFYYIQQGVEIGLDTENFKDQAASLAIEIIEKEIISKNGVNEERKASNVTSSMSEKLLSEIRRIYPISQGYSQRIENIAALIKQQKTLTVSVSSPNLAFAAPINPNSSVSLQSHSSAKKSRNPDRVSFCNIDSEFTKLNEIGSIYKFSHQDFTVELKKVKFIPINHLATLKQYTPNSDSWNRRAVLIEINILKMLSDSSENDNCLLEYYSSQILQNVYIFMEYCDDDLKKLIDRKQMKNEVFTSRELEKLIGSLLKGFAIIHQKNIHHRDIKPSNILIKKINYDYVTKIADFGCSSDFTDKNYPQVSRTIAGCPDYWPPEYFEYAKNPVKGSFEQDYYSTKKADIYSLGLTFLYMTDLVLTKDYNLPENNSRLQARIQKVKILWIENLLKDMLCLDPNDRKEFSYLRKHLPQEDTLPK